MATNADTRPDGGDAPFDEADHVAPDDAVGNALCDALLAEPDAAGIQRVLDHYLGEVDTTPGWRDYRDVLQASACVALEWSPERARPTVYYRQSGSRSLFERVRVQDDHAVSDIRAVSKHALADVYAAYGAPELVPVDAVAHYFEGGEGV